MSEQKINAKQPAAEQPKAEQPAPAKQGFFARIVNKIDGAMKEKADQKSQQGCCGSDGKGGKCC